MGIFDSITRKYGTIDKFIQMYRENKVSTEELDLFNDLIEIDSNPYSDRYSKLVHAIYGQTKKLREKFMEKMEKLK